MSLFSTYQKSTGARTPQGALLRAIDDVLADAKGDLSAVAGFAFAREGDTLPANAVNQYDSLNKSITQQLKSRISAIQGLPSAITDNLDSKLACAVESAVLASRAGDAVRRGAQVKPTINGVPFVGTHGLYDGFGDRMQVARESYSEQDNQNVLRNSVGYALMAGNQNPFGEMFFHRVTVPSDNMGVSVTIRLTQVMRDRKRNLNGDATDYGRKNLVFGMIDPSILRNDSTRAVPVYRAENASKFAAGIAASNKTFEGEVISTAPLAFGAELDLGAMSQTAAMLAAGSADRTDALDPDAKIENVYLSLPTATSGTKQYIAIPTAHLATNNFIWAGQDLAKVQKLNFETKQLWIQPGTKSIAGVDLAGALAVLKTKKLAVRLGGYFSGSLNIEEGRLVVNAAGLKVLEVVDQENQVVVTSGADFDAIKAAIEGNADAKFVGYDVEARRANANKAERGDLLDTQYYTQIWGVPFRSPITALRPVHEQFHTESADLELLSQATYIRASGAAVDTIFQTVDLLRSIKGSELSSKDVPELLGVARFLIKPYLLEGTVALENNTQITDSAQLADAISAVLVNRIRDAAYRIFRDSQLQGAVEAGAPGTTDYPTVLVGCDPMLSRYLMVSGDMRLLGPDFKMEVKTSPALKMQNKIVIGFGYPGQVSTDAVQPFHFGSFLWSPDLAMVVQVSREGRTSKELTVQPRFRHIVNLPVMAVLTVTGIERVVGKRVPLDANILSAVGLMPNP